MTGHGVVLVEVRRGVGLPVGSGVGPRVAVISGRRPAFALVIGDSSSSLLPTSLGDLEFRT